MSKETSGFTAIFGSSKTVRRLFSLQFSVRVPEQDYKMRSNHSVPRRRGIIRSVEFELHHITVIVSSPLNGIVCMSNIARPKEDMQGHCRDAQKTTLPEKEHLKRVQHCSCSEKPCTAMPDVQDELGSLPHLSLLTSEPDLDCACSLLDLVHHEYLQTGRGYDPSAVHHGPAAEDSCHTIMQRWVLLSLPGQDAALSMPSEGNCNFPIILDVVLSEPSVHRLAVFVHPLRPPAYLSSCFHRYVTSAEITWNRMKVPNMTYAVAGISLQTQELYALVFICRYLDIFTRFISL